jgi:hypothetical protein
VSEVRGKRGCSGWWSLIKEEQMTEWIGGLQVDVKSAQLSGRTNYVTTRRKLKELFQTRWRRE